MRLKPGYPSKVSPICCRGHGKILHEPKVGVSRLGLRTVNRRNTASNPATVEQTRAKTWVAASSIHRCLAVAYSVYHEKVDFCEPSRVIYLHTFLSCTPFSLHCSPPASPTPLRRNLSLSTTPPPLPYGVQPSAPYTTAGGDGHATRYRKGCINGHGSKRRRATRQGGDLRRRLRMHVPHSRRRACAVLRRSSARRRRGHHRSPLQRGAAVFVRRTGPSGAGAQSGLLRHVCARAGPGRIAVHADVLHMRVWVSCSQLRHAGEGKSVQLSCVCPR